MNTNYPKAYHSLTPDDVDYLNSLIWLTSKTCKDSGVAVIRRDKLADFIRKKWQLPDPMSVYAFNQMALVAYRVLENCPLRIKAPSASKYILADSGKRVVDWVLTDKQGKELEFLRECENRYLDQLTKRKSKKKKGKTMNKSELVYKGYTIVWCEEYPFWKAWVGTAGYHGDTKDEAVSYAKEYIDSLTKGKK